ncbi:MAG: TraR/DksA family transcriptional regulator [Hydrogenophaga sp.]|uniref:TraR/DksA family transcriptional regulator n=1 Tax=Hydrogenophaga sp. TaxID=1904254 RepID=UPI00257EB2F8|nr:TraR/DksA family transcriptional regulator [Hydrogenophaga sp.]MBL0942734.1 TraR/DksA family transcriptional regulator [Hydrogenophaga sp.]
MSKPVSDTFRLQLVTRRDELLARLQGQRGGARSRAEAASDKRERADDRGLVRDDAFDLGAELGERETAELQAIERALERVHDGSYGLCLQCGAPIPAARLHAQPTAERCVACQARAE